MQITSAPSLVEVVEVFFNVAEMYFQVQDK